VRWIIDPLDGTANYYVGYPSHAVSIGVYVDDGPVLGVVHDTASGTVYVGSVDEPAHADDHRITVRGAVPLERAVLATGFAPLPKYREMQAAVLAHVLPLIGDMRRSGSPALDLCAVAAGRLNGFFEIGLPEWDYAAGQAIVAAAGGSVEVVDTPADWPGPVVAAGHPTLVERLLDMGAEAGIPIRQ
jgi:myo-inositol-1(or 4)-monophosphatase